ncbi:MAG: site-2 protease family protein [Planctomycetota bacterium]
MFDLPGPLGTIANLLVVIIGFGGIIFIHELGHFLAARWAGVRVLAFSIGMGPVVCSYRRGMGFRRGSNDTEYQQLLSDAQGPRGVQREHARTQLSGIVSPTEYRFSALPLGGYVKMLGQEDINPGAVSDAPDSYQNRPVWKRMVVISAGVVFNLISAAALFIVVFMVGLETQSPIVGSVAEGSPASRAVAIDRDDIEPGLLLEDRIISVDGHGVRAFNEISTEIAMSGGGPIAILVDRPGSDQIRFEVEPERSELSGFLGIGIGAAQSTTIAADPLPGLRADLERVTASVGLGMYVPGARVTSINGVTARRPNELSEAAADSEGTPIRVMLTDPDGSTRERDIVPERQLQRGGITTAGATTGIEHLLGLRGLLSVDPAATPEGVRQGLKPGDIFVRIADAEYPGYHEAISLIRSLNNQRIEIEVLRGGDRVTIEVNVDTDGRIGFHAQPTLRTSALIARPAAIAEPSDAATPGEPAAARLTPAHKLIDRAGTRIIAIGGEPIESVADIAGVIRSLTDTAFASGDMPEVFEFVATLQLPLPGEPVEQRPWSLAREDVERVRSLGWQMPAGDTYRFLFDADLFIDKAEGPVAAVFRGIAKSRQTMNQTYLTFLRLFQGTVKIEHLKGPVGIAHLGTQVADQGFIWLLFFLGLVSVNLAVINFLPLPIVDGGQFLMLAYEGIRRKPVPILFQNVVTLAGLLLIGSVFLVVTFHDLRALFGG